MVHHGLDHGSFECHGLYHRIFHGASSPWVAPWNIPFNHMGGSMVRSMVCPTNGEHHRFSKLPLCFLARPIRFSGGSCSSELEPINYNWFLLNNGLDHVFRTGIVERGQIVKTTNLWKQKTTLESPRKTPGSILRSLRVFRPPSSKTHSFGKKNSANLKNNFLILVGLIGKSYTGI